MTYEDILTGGMVQKFCCMPKPAVCILCQGDILENPYCIQCIIGGTSFRTFCGFVCKSIRSMCHQCLIFYSLDKNAKQVPPNIMRHKTIAAIISICNSLYSTFGSYIYDVTSGGTFLSWQFCRPNEIPPSLDRLDFACLSPARYVLQGGNMRSRKFFACLMPISRAKGKRICRSRRWRPPFARFTAVFEY